MSIRNRNRVPCLKVKSWWIDKRKEWNVSIRVRDQSHGCVELECHRIVLKYLRSALCLLHSPKLCLYVVHIVAWELPCGMGGSTAIPPMTDTVTPLMQSARSASALSCWLIVSRHLKHPNSFPYQILIHISLFFI